MKMGATGRFPRGKINAGDEGELRMAVGVTNKTVVVDFGKPVAWLGLDADTAEALGRLLMERAAEARK